MLVSTFDSMFESKPAPFRILHRTPQAPGVYYEIAHAFTREDILDDWYWLVTNIFTVLREIESHEEVTNFTLVKIQSLVAQEAVVAQQQRAAGGGDGSSSSGSLASSSGAAAGPMPPMATVPEKREAERVQQLFGLAANDQIVQYFGCK